MRQKLEEDHLKTMNELKKKFQSEEEQLRRKIEKLSQVIVYYSFFIK